MGPNVECPNPACQKLYVMADTIPFRCSACGTRIEFQAGSDARQQHLAREKSARRRREWLGRAKYVFGALALGFMFHTVNFIAALIFVLSLVWLAYIVIFRRSIPKKYPVAIVVLLFVFLVGSIGGDAAWPPTATCSDGSLSYSAHHSGTCSWHGGVSEWNPGPWWAWW